MNRLRVSLLGRVSHDERPNIVQTWCIARRDEVPLHQHLVTSAVSLGGPPVVVVVQGHPDAARPAVVPVLEVPRDRDRTCAVRKLAMQAHHGSQQRHVLSAQAYTQVLGSHVQGCELRRRQPDTAGRLRHRQVGGPPEVEGKPRPVLPSDLDECLAEIGRKPAVSESVKSVNSSSRMVRSAASRAQTRAAYSLRVTRRANGSSRESWSNREPWAGPPGSGVCTATT